MHACTMESLPARPRPRAARNPAPKRRALARARPALLWGIGIFVCAQVVFTILINRWMPVLRDPEYGSKLALLRARIAEAPDRPLLLVLGSSRTGVGFRPDVLALEPLPDGRRPLVFNFGVTGAGPITELVCLHRLRADGIRPVGIVVEVLPPMLHQDVYWGEEIYLNYDRLGWSDLPVLSRHLGDRRRLYRKWLAATLTPWSTQRFCIMSRYAPAWLAWSSRQDVWRDLDNWGWLSYPRPAVDSAEYQRALQVAYRTYAPALNEFRVTHPPDRALRELLTVCGAEHIPVLLMLMPEGSEFRSWYAPCDQAALQRYLTELGQAYGVPVVDAHAWIADGSFVDSHHLLPGGAAAFTERFGREALPLLMSKIGKQHRPARPSGCTGVAAPSALP